MRITEIFFSIQGESTFAGQPCIFVRLTGCPLRCMWCDTAYAFYEGVEYTVDQVLAQIAQYDCRLVEVTGGEPLAQKDAYALVTALADRDYVVLIETSGAIDISGVDPRARLIMDVKCPGSGMADRNHWDNMCLLKPTDEIKFVIKNRADYDWAVTVLTDYRVAHRHSILFSPVFGELDAQALAEWILADQLPVRFQLQLHKLIWSPTARGV